MPEAGRSIGAFYVTKVAGATEDGVAVGDELCYRCKYGSRPMVMVFTRKDSGKVAEFVGQLDKAVGKHKEDQLRGLVTVMVQINPTSKLKQPRLLRTRKLQHSCRRRCR